MTCIYSKVVVELTFNALDLKREARPWLFYLSIAMGRRRYPVVVRKPTLFVILNY